MENKTLITELIFLKFDLERKSKLYKELKEKLNKRELNQEEKELVKKYDLLRLYRRTNNR